MKNVRDRTEINWKGRWMSAGSTSHFIALLFVEFVRGKVKVMSIFCPASECTCYSVSLSLYFFLFFKRERAQYWILLKIKWLTATTGSPSSRSKSVPVQNTAYHWYHRAVHSVIISEKNLIPRQLLRNHISSTSELALKNVKQYPRLQLKLGTILYCR